MTFDVMSDTTLKHIQQMNNSDKGDNPERSAAEDYLHLPAAVDLHSHTRTKTTACSLQQFQATPTGPEWNYSQSFEENWHNHLSLAGQSREDERMDIDQSQGMSSPDGTLRAPETVEDDDQPLPRLFENMEPILEENLDNFETPPTTPNPFFLSRRRFVNHHSQDKTLNISVPRPESLVNDSGSEKDPTLYNSMASPPLKCQDSGDNSSLKIPDFPKVISPSILNDDQNASAFPTLGLYQRRKMRRQFLRLQSLEEVAAGRLFSDSTDSSSTVSEGALRDEIEDTLSQVGQILLS